jgi:hypothetical protein
MRRRLELSPSSRSYKDPGNGFRGLWLVALILLLLLRCCCSRFRSSLLVSLREGNVNRHQYPRTVQSATCNLIDPGRNSDLRGPGDRKFPDLDDGEDELVGLGLVGS